MKRLGLVICLVFWGNSLHAEVLKAFKEITETAVFPHHYEGLQPLLEPKHEDYFLFRYDENGRVINISYFDKKGLLKVNREVGWAFFQVQYDAKGRVTETSCHKVDQKLTTCKKLGFARETLVYGSKGELEKQIYWTARGGKQKSAPDWRQQMKLLQP